MPPSSAREILRRLNALHVGQLDRMDEELGQAVAGLRELAEEDLAVRSEEARRALRRGDLREFRRALANVTARLGHVK